MKRQIRFGVFETNSSSTHSLTMTSSEEFNKWSSGKLYYWDRGFYTREECIQELKKEPWFKDANWENEKEVNEIFLDERILTYEDFFENFDYEIFCDSYITPSGEEVVAFGYFGYDG